MKKSLLLAVVVALVATGAMAQGVVNSKHDLSSTLTTSQQVCVFCHTPHNSNQDAGLEGVAPLWNHTLSTAVVNYGTYTSDTFDATDLAAVTPNTNPTGLCLSCHDGTVAVGSQYNKPNTTSGEDTSSAGLIATISASADLGTSLANDHPVNFTYASSVTGGDTELVTEATIVEYLDTGAAGGKVQCTSCHDPHTPGPDPDINFMRVTMVDSGLCTTCHVK